MHRFEWRNATPPGPAQLSGSFEVKWLKRGEKEPGCEMKVQTGESLQAGGATPPPRR